MTEATGGGAGSDPVFQIVLKDIVCMPTHAAVETLVGLGINPLLKASDQGKLRGPDGDSFDLNITEACFKWANVKCMAGSPAQGWGVVKSGASTDADFMREITNCASQMSANGVGLVMLLASVTSGPLQDKLREIFVRALADDGKWEALTGWTKWRGRDPSRFSEADRRKAVADATSWNATWVKLSADVIAELYPSENGATVDALKAYSKYGSIMKRKKIVSVDAALLEEVELYGLLKASGMVIPWIHRRETRNFILRAHYGPLVVSLLVQLEACEDCPSWDLIFKKSRLALDPFVQVEPPKSPAPVYEPTPGRSKQPNRIEARRARDQRFERKIRDAGAPIKSPEIDAIKPSLSVNPACFHCGGPHLKRDCPQLNLPRRSPRLASNVPANEKRVSFGDNRQSQKRMGLLARATKDEESEVSEYEDPETSDVYEDFEAHVDGDRSDDSKSGFGLFGPAFNSKVRTVDIMCNGQRCKFVIDGGADLSLIKRDQVKTGCVVKPTNVVLEGLAGKVHIKESLECNFAFGKRDLGIIDFLPGGVDGLLGIDLVDEIDIPAVVEFRKAYENLQSGLETPQLRANGRDDCTWTPMFEYVKGPLREADLRKSVADLKLPVMDCYFDSAYPSIRERGRPTPFRWREKAGDMVEELVEDGVMKEVDQNCDGWYSPGIFIPKVGESGELKLRFVIDYKTVNKRVIKHHTATYPHTASTLISSVKRTAAWFSKVDIRNAFFNLPLADRIKPFLRTSVMVSGKQRIFEMQKGPQGFSETPVWWVSFIDEVLRSLRKILRPLYGDNFDIKGYVDDLLVFAESRDMCQRIHDALLQYLRCLGIPFGKVVEPCQEVTVIGLVFSSKGVRMAKTDSMADLSTPKDKTQLRTALGVFQYVRKAYDTNLFVECVGTLSKLLRKNAAFVWDDDAQRAWDGLADGFSNVYYQFFSSEDQLREGECFIVQTDASDSGIASALWLADQAPDGAVDPEWFNQHAKLLNTRCRTFNQEEAKYPTWDKEALSVFEALNEYGAMVTAATTAEGQLYVMSDSNAALQRWRNVLAGGTIDEKCAAGPRARRWHRWVDDLSIIFHLDPRFVHIAGENNQVADYFSRALAQISGSVTATARMGLLGSISQQPDAGTAEVPNPFMSDLLARVKEQAIHDSNDDEYQGRLIRDILRAEDDSTAFRLVDGIPYLCATGESPRLYVPKGRAVLGGEEVDMRVALIALAHQSHEGVTRTTNAMKAYYWPRMSQLIRAYIGSCPHCQKKNIKANYGRLTGRTIPQRFDRIVIDHATPQLLGKNPTGLIFRHVLIIIDSFSRYVRMIPVHSMDTAETTDHLLKWALDYGFPREIVSDNASVLRNALIERALSITSRADPDLHRWVAPVQYPQAQGEAERVVRELKSYINVRNTDTWPQVLPFLTFAHNSAAYGASGISPHLLVHGSEPTRLVDLASWPISDPLPASADEYIDELKHRLSDFHELHQLKMSEYRQSSRDYYNARHAWVEFSVGDKVWIVRHSNFKSDITGPAVIEGKRGDHMYVADGKLVPLQHLVPYVESEHVDRSGIAFAESFQESHSALKELLKIDPRQLKAGDLVLVQRGRTPQDAYPQAVYEYDLGIVGENTPATETIRVDLMNLDDLTGRKWKRTGLQFAFSYQAILASGFKLTKTQELRSSTLRSWRAVGLVE